VRATKILESSTRRTEPTRLYLYILERLGSYSAREALVRRQIREIRQVVLKTTRFHVARITSKIQAEK